MSRIFKTLVFFVALGIIIYAFHGSWKTNLTAIEQTFFPCQNPITYNIGTFDSKFGLSKADFLSAVNQAADIWQMPFGRELFKYMPDGNLKINLIYDYRQEATAKLQKLGITVTDDKASYDSLKIKYDEMKADYALKKQQFESLLNGFQARQDAYNKEVELWNTKGGAPENIYNSLNQEKNLLNSDLEKINLLRADLNSEVDNVNAFVVALNRLVASLNLNVSQYNAIGESRGSEFEEGIYQSGPGGEEIDIYQYDSRAKLVRVLAHELGHALGLEHLDNPKAIMYKFNQGTNEKLTTDDLSALKARCGVK